MVDARDRDPRDGQRISSEVDDVPGFPGAAGMTRAEVERKFRGYVGQAAAPRERYGTPLLSGICGRSDRIRQDIAAGELARQQCSGASRLFSVPRISKRRIQHASA